MTNEEKAFAAASAAAYRMNNWVPLGGQGVELIISIVQEEILKHFSEEEDALYNTKDS